MSRLYFLSKLRSFSMCSKMYGNFKYTVFSGSLLGSSIRAVNTSRLHTLINDGSVISCKPDNFGVVLGRMTLNNLLSIMDNAEHPIHY